MISLLPRLASLGEHKPSLQRVENKERDEGAIVAASAVRRGEGGTQLRRQQNALGLFLYILLACRGDGEGDRWQTLMGQCHKIFDFRFF
jgi:hypothetical protein